MLIIVESFSDKDLHAFILEGSKKIYWVLVTQKEDNCMGECVQIKEWLEMKKKFLDVHPRKDDKNSKSSQ